MLTYGDGVANVNIERLVEFHKTQGKIATITAVNVGQQFGVLDIGEDGSVNRFREKNNIDLSPKSNRAFRMEYRAWYA